MVKYNSQSIKGGFVMEMFQLSVIFDDRNRFTVEFDHYDQYVRAVCKISEITRKLQEGSYEATTMRDFRESIIYCAEELQKMKNFW